MTPPDGVYEASFGRHPWGQRFVGRDEIRAALLDMGLDRPGRSRHAYGETYVVGDCAFALWTSVQEGPTGSETTMHGADFYRFSDGMLAAKIAYRKNRQFSRSGGRVRPRSAFFPKPGARGAVITV